MTLEWLSGGCFLKNKMLDAFYRLLMSSSGTYWSHRTNGLFRVAASKIQMAVGFKRKERCFAFDVQSRLSTIQRCRL